MMKIFGAGFVTIASFMVGWAARQGISIHLNLLRQLRLALEIMQGEMELNMPPLNRLFETVGQRTQGQIGGFFTTTAIKMTEATGRPPVMAMRLAMEEQPVYFTQEEKAMVYELGGALGRYDLGGQARAIDLYRQRVDRLIEEGENTRRQKAKAWMTASVCSGLMLILLLL